MFKTSVILSYIYMDIEGHLNDHLALAITSFQFQLLLYHIVHLVGTHFQLKLAEFDCFR